MAYIFISIPLLLFSILSLFVTEFRKNTKLLSIPFIIVLSIMAGIRSGTGTDFYNYRSIWNNIPPLYSFNESSTYLYLEPGFRLFASFLKMFSNSEVLFFSSMALLTIGILYIGLNKIHGLNVLVAVTLFFMIFYMPYVFNAMRQAVAMSFFVYAIPSIVNGNLMKTVVISCIAASFHYSGFAILIAFPFAQIKANNILFLLYITILSLVLKFSGIVTFLFDLIFAGKYSRWILKDGEPLPLSQIGIRYLVAITLVLIAHFLIKSDYLRRILNIYLLGLVFYIVFMDTGTYATRFNLFFRILEIVLFPLIINYTRFVGNRIIFFCISLILGLYIFSINIGGSSNQYNTIFH